MVEPPKALRPLGPAALPCSGVTLKNVQYIQSDANQAKHAENMKQNARKKKIQDSLKAGGYSDDFAKMASDMMHREPLAPLAPTTEVSQIDHSRVMVFDGAAPGVGAPIYDSVCLYQQKSHQKCSDKFATLHEYLNEQGPRGKPNIATPVRHRDFKAPPSEWDNELPDLTVALKLVNGSSYETEAGSSPWLVHQRPWVELMAVKAMPLAGCASLIQHYEYSYAATSFVIVAVNELLQAGLTVLSDLPGFCKNESGVNVFKDKAIVVTLEKPHDLLWIPEGHLAIPIGREPWSEKTQRSCTYWVKTFLCPVESALMPHSVWTATKLLNQSYLRKLQGQNKAWKERMQMFEQFVADRAALVLGFHDDTAPTMFDADDQQQAVADSLAATAEENARNDLSEDEKPLTGPAKAPPRPRATPKYSAKSAAATGTKLGGRPKAPARPRHK